MATYKAIIETDEPLGQFAEHQIEILLQPTALNVSVELEEVE